MKNTISPHSRKTIMAWVLGIFSLFVMCASVYAAAGRCVPCKANWYCIAGTPYICPADRPVTSGTGHDSESDCMSCETRNGAGQAFFGGYHLGEGYECVSCLENDLTKPVWNGKECTEKSNIVYVNSDWSGTGARNWLGIDGSTQRYIGYDAIASLPNAVSLIKPDDNGKGVIYIVKSGTYSSGSGAFMTSGVNGNNVTDMVINGDKVDPDATDIRVGQAVISNGVVAMDSLRSGSLSLNNISVSGNIYGGTVINENINASSVETELAINGGYYLSSQITAGADVQSGKVSIGSTKLTISNTYASQNGDDLTALGRIIGGGVCW